MPPLSRPRALVLLAAVVLLWGANWPIMKVGLDHMPPFRFAALRVVMGGLLLGVIVAFQGRLALPPRRDWPILLSVGMLQVTVPLALMHFGLQFVEAGRSAILAYTIPLWVLPMAVLLLGERPGWPRIGGMALGLAGVAVLFEPGAFDPADGDAMLGNALLLLAAVSIAAAIVHIRGHRWTASPLELMPWQMLMAGVVLAGLSLGLESDVPQDWPGSLLAVLTYNGPVASAFCFWAYVTAARALPATSTALGSLGVPVTGLLASVLFLDEALTPAKVAGLGLIAAGVTALILAERKGAKKN